MIGSGGGAEPTGVEQVLSFKTLDRLARELFAEVRAQPYRKPLSKPSGDANGGVGADLLKWLINRSPVYTLRNRDLTLRQLHTLVGTQIATPGLAKEETVEEASRRWSQSCSTRCTS